MAKLKKIEKALKKIIDSDVSMQTLLLIAICRKPKSYQEIQDLADINYSCALKIIARNPDYFVKQKAKIMSRESGRHPTEIHTTEKGLELIKLIE